MYLILKDDILYIYIICFVFTGHESYNSTNIDWSSLKVKFGFKSFHQQLSNYKNKK